MELNPNDPLIPYLVAARQEKIKAQQEAEANATNSAIEQQQKLAWQLFQETGIANDFIASALGIPVGTTTMDYKKNQYDINKRYYKPIDDGGDGDKEAISKSYANDILYNEGLTLAVDNTPSPVPGLNMSQYNIALRLYDLTKLGLSNANAKELLAENGVPFDAINELF
jgi:hypothetical protein